MPAGKTENIKQVRLSQLFPFERHPFKVNNDAEMLKIVESVKQYGVLCPAYAGWRVRACIRPPAQAGV